jgi:tRNA(Ile)-lysidine synthase
MTLTDHIAGFLDRHGLHGTVGVVAVSGGPDSIALAHALVHSSPVQRIVIAHVNHRLRGAESDADEAFVAALPAIWRPEDPTRLTCRVTRFDTREEARGENLEAFAREQRYKWLAQMARTEEAAWVAAAHTADDQAETVLFRLLRGSGLDGLRAMPACRPLEGAIDLVRPLLTARRADVLAYLQSEQQPFREDSSNRDCTFTRNRIRHDLMPRLEADHNPALVASLCRLAEQAQDVQAEMHALAAELLNRAELPRAGDMLVFRRDVLAAAPPHRVREMFRLVWTREGWPQSAMGFDEWQRLVTLVHGDVPAWDLPGGVYARNASRVIQLSRQLQDRTIGSSHGSPKR